VRRTLDLRKLNRETTASGTHSFDGKQYKASQDTIAALELCLFENNCHENGESVHEKSTTYERSIFYATWCAGEAHDACCEIAIAPASERRDPFRPKQVLCAVIAS
jgi:hypothetical protein